MVWASPMDPFCDVDDPELAILALGFIFVQLGKEEEERELDAPAS